MRRQSDNPKSYAWGILDRIQLYRNLPQVMQALPSIPTEPPQVWLAHVIALPTSQRVGLESALKNEIPGWEQLVRAMYDNPVIQGIASKADPVERTIDILKFAHANRRHGIVEMLESTGVQNAKEWARYLKKAQGNNEQFYDYSIEAHYALSFAKCGLFVTLKPRGEKGPDLKVVIAGADVFVEVSRFREDEDLSAEMTLELEQEGQAEGMVEKPNTSQNVLRKIAGELHHAIPNRPFIILLLSTNVGVNELDFQQALVQSKEPLAECSGIVFVDSWQKVGDTSYPRAWGFMNRRAAIPVQPGTLQQLGQCVDSNFRIINDR